MRFKNIFEMNLSIKKILFRSFSIFIIELFSFNLATAEESKNVAINLISEYSKIQPGKTFNLGLAMRHNQGWHTYWKNPGDSGLPTTINWMTPDILYGEIQWPAPHKFTYGNVNSYGLTGEEILIIPVTVPKSFSKDVLKIEADVKWLECNEICIPSKKFISITLPVGKKPEINTDTVSLFSEARKNLGSKSNNKKIKAVLLEENLAFEIKNRADIKDAYFFPYDENIVEGSLTQSLVKNKDKYELTVGKLGSDINIAGGIMVLDYANGTQEKVLINNKIKKSDSCLDQLFN
jgi:DsbC/DsbD-like thiol-disulfide interchange protein